MVAEVAEVEVAGGGGGGGSGGSGVKPSLLASYRRGSLRAAAAKREATYKERRIHRAPHPVPKPKPPAPPERPRPAVGVWVNAGAAVPCRSASLR